jgi:hypothetical protein
MAKVVNFLLPTWQVGGQYVAAEVDSVYVAGSVVYVENEQPNFIDRIYRCLQTHTAVSFATDFGNGLWEEIVVRGVKGDKGDTGDKGEKGDTGVQGAQGSAGAAGANGIFSEIASQGEAQTGTNNDKGMTPLRTAEALAFQVPNLSVITTLQSDVVTVDGRVDSLTSRVNILEGLSDLDIARGKQRINNNQAAPLALEGRDSVGEAGVGDPLLLTPAGALSARVEYELQRKSDTDLIFITGVLRLQFVDGDWYVGKESTLNLIGGDPDGLTFTIVTDPVTNVGQVFYTSNTVSGTYNVSESYMLWSIREIQKNF